jgi:gluconokinase
MVIIVFGVTGAGKTEIGRRLARELGWSFYDADQFHPPESIEKMRQGIPLTDNDRWPWLERLRGQVTKSLDAGENAVLACSALKIAYRQRLAVNGDVKLVYLKGDYALFAQRLRNRGEHFMNPVLLRSQFDTLEDPKGERALVVDAQKTPAELVQRIRAELGV